LEIQAIKKPLRRVAKLNIYFLINFWLEIELELHHIQL